MIECTSKNVWYKKGRKKRKRRFLRFFIFILIFAFITLYGRFVVSVNLTRICTNYAYSYITESVNEAILYSLSNKVKYDDLIRIEKDSSGQIVLMSTDSYKINQIKGEIVKYSDIFIKEKLKKGVPVPVLAFLGLEFLSGYGFLVNFKSLSLSSVESNFLSTFESMGINQTLHGIYVEVKSTVKIHIPLYSQTKEFTTKVLISEAVLVGKVPDMYLGGSLFD